MSSDSLESPQASAQNMLSLFAAVEALRVPPPMMNQAQAEAAAKAAWLAKTSQPGPLAANNGYVVPTGMAPAHELYEDRVLGSHSGSATQYEYGMEHPSTNWALAPGGMPGVSSRALILAHVCRSSPRLSSHPSFLCLTLIRPSSRVHRLWLLRPRSPARPAPRRPRRSS